jgi:hypothetical protein
MSATRQVLGGSPGSRGEKLKNAGWRSLRTLAQGVVAAFPAAGPGSTILNESYWLTFGVGCLTAATAAFVAFLQNALVLIPDPGQSK